ncbi:MAG: BA3454 family stress response protein [Bacillota bacterium]|nr:BA3454 family stress response protein [Bacillota bacterium]
MIEVIVTVKYKDKNYQTNVIINKEMSDEKIKYLAEKQIKKQWGI